jgi:hypothetical protein
MCKATANISATPVPLFAFDCCFVLCFHSTLRCPEPLLSVLIAAWSTADGFEQPRLKVIVVVHLLLLFFRVHLRPSWLSHPLLLSCLDYPSSRLPTESRSKEGVDCCIYPPNLPSHLVQKHIISNDHRLCLCVCRACFVGPRQSNRQPRWRRRQQKAFERCWVAPGGHRPTIRRPLDMVSMVVLSVK